jgi:glycerol-3-phosphate dehydrogenase
VSQVPGSSVTAPHSCDVVVVGAGVVGTAIARELARYPLRTALLDADPDVGNGTSKANTAILHTGFDAEPGSLESRLVRRGHTLLAEYAKDVGIAVEPTGALLTAWDDEQLRALPALAAKASANGYAHARPVDTAELYAREPHLGPGARGALEVPGESIICPWSTTIAFATQAVRSGVSLRLGSAVRSISDGGGRHLVETDRGQVSCRYLVNAAGLGADLIDRQLGIADFSITPRRGQLIVFDKLARSLVSHILLPVPTGRTKGVLVAPTVYGNVLLGPTAEDLDDRSDTATTREGLDSLLDKGSRIVPDLVREEVTAVYAGLRAATEHADYQIRAHPALRYVTVGGIRSTGLTASIAIAEHVVGLLTESGLGLGEPRELAPVRVPNLGEAGPRPYQQPDLIAADPAFGTIVCHCERVTLGEITAAMRSEIKPHTLDGLRRRTRALNGRCQGFACGAVVRGLFEGAGQP